MARRTPPRYLHWYLALALACAAALVIQLTITVEGLRARIAEDRRADSRSAMLRLHPVIRGGGRRQRRGLSSRVARACVLWPVVWAGALDAQQPTGGVVTGQVTTVESGQPVVGALVSIEGSPLRVLSGVDGHYRIAHVPAGPQSLRVEMLGYAVVRLPINAAPGSVLERNVELAVSALQVDGVTITADPVGRARGELGTATVIDRAAIQFRTATSLAGILELVPGVPVQPPGIDGIQQIALRSVPTAGLGADALGAGADNLASAGTLIVLDGVPMSNNANLQSLGPRGELPVPSSAGGGVDLRRIPAATLDRVEVIRGIPSARYGDLTQGAIVVDTRAGVVLPEAFVRRDQHTTQFGFGAGTPVGRSHILTGFADLTRTLLAPGQREDHSTRAAAQLSHRLLIEGSEQTTLDSRLEYFQLERDVPEIAELALGASSSSRDTGLRLSSRFRTASDDGNSWEIATSIDRQWQRASRSQQRQRSALPFTDRLTEGRAIGRFIGGPYIAELAIEGDPWFHFGRVEHARRLNLLGAQHDLHLGLEWRREWNTGNGYLFDMEFPPQVTFNGVEGFDRPRRFSDLPALATSALYADNRMAWHLGAARYLSLQAGMRMDVLHEPGGWTTGVRDIAIQPRLNVEFSPSSALRLRAGWGTTAKLPTMADLAPGLQYHDIVNVNWFTDDPAERLAVVTTTILDPTNPDLGISRGSKAEFGVELSLGPTGSGLSVVAFDDRIHDGIGLRLNPVHLVREHFQLRDSTIGTGRPPEILEPAFAVDSVPVLLLRPHNMIDVRTYGVEATLALPEVRALRSKVDIQGAWIRSEVRSEGMEVVQSRFETFQLEPTIPRTPYWQPSERFGDRLILNYRIAYQEPAIGLAITASVQHTAHESTRRAADIDSLSFSGYITRGGEVVPVAASERGRAEYHDLQLPRNVNTERRHTIPDWLLSLQVAKTLPHDGRISFFAFNLLDRLGRVASTTTSIGRSHPPMRFGLELTVVLGAWFR